MADRSSAERSAWKNDRLFWSNRDTGAQDLNVELDKNVSKNVGHDVEVKLVPKDESNGTGRGVVTTVTEGTDVEVLVVCDCTVEVDSVVDEVVVSWPTCRLPRSDSGLVSICIAPTKASRSNMSRSSPSCCSSYAAVECSSDRHTVKDASSPRLRPGRRDCDEVDIFSLR